MALPPLIQSDLKEFTYSFQEWLRQLHLLATGISGTIPWVAVSKTGSDLTDLVTRLHNSLQSPQGGTSGEYYHLTSAAYTDLTDSGDSTLHYHAADRASANFTGTNWTDLTDAGDSILHYHASDRARANHTGTQALATISDAGTIASQSAGAVAITGGTITGTTVSGLTLASATVGFTVAGGTSSKTLTMDMDVTISGLMNFAAAHG